MPDLRPFAIALVVGLGIAGYTVLWWHWAPAIGIGLGIIFGGLALASSTSGGGDGAAADAAWRAAASDLLEPRVGPVGPGDDPAGG
jgi:hypothetical protein